MKSLREFELSEWAKEATYCYCIVSERKQRHEIEVALNAGFKKCVELVREFYLNPPEDAKAKDLLDYLQSKTEGGK